VAFDGTSFIQTNKIQNTKQYKAVCTPGATAIGHFDNQTQAFTTLLTREQSSIVIVIKWSLL